jgi:GNAT superfamily N-acetyltransferase
VPLSTPALLAEHHDLNSFDSGEPPLDDWLRKRARGNHASGASRVYVTCNNEGEGRRVAGYYALASGSISQELASGSFRRNMPDPVPAVILGRLAVDKNWQGQGAGRSLMHDAALRVIHAADTIGIRGIVVHALSDNARAFYLALGFKESPGQPRTLTITIKELQAAIAS